MKKERGSKPFDEIETIYLAAINGDELSDHGVKETPENIALYWRLRLEANEIVKSGNALHIPN